MRERHRRRRGTRGPGRSPAGASLLLAIWLAPGAVVSLEGCTPETRYRVLSTVFDDVPPPGTPKPPRRRRRRVARVEPPAPPPATEEVEGMSLTELAREAEPEYETYADVLEAFPKDAMGNVNWVAAVEQALIRPRPGIEPDATEFPVLPYDVRLDPGIPALEVVFPHAAHTYWLRCDNCHPQIFQMKAGSNPITMAKIFAGEYCGRCHGKVAFPPQTGCPRCHVRLGGPAG